MTAAPVRYAILGLVTFAVGLVAFLPAQVAAGWAESLSPVSLGGVTGTLFHGHAAYASGPEGNVEDLNWTLHPGALLLGRISADVDVASDLDGFSASVSRSLFGTLRVDNASGHASAGWLARLGGYTFLPISGDLGVDIDTATFDDALDFSALSGSIRLAHTRWQLLNPPLELGRFTTALSTIDNGIRLAIVDTSGDLAIDGDVTIDHSRRYNLDVRLRARAGADKRLSTLLNQLGPADDEGWHRVREQGRL